MTISAKDIKKIATLSQLSFTQGELDAFIPKFNTILSYMEILNTIDTTDVLPMSHALKIDAHFRKDDTHPFDSTELLIKNAPINDGTFFKVPKVIKK